MSLTVIEFQSWKGPSTNSRKFLGGGKTSTDLELEPYSLGQAEGPWEKDKGRSGLSLLQAQQRLFTRMCPGRFPNTSQVPSSGHRGSSARRQGRHRVGAGTAPAPPTAKRPPGLHRGPEKPVRGHQEREWELAIFRGNPGELAKQSGATQPSSTEEQGCQGLGSLSLSNQTRLG